MRFFICSIIVPVAIGVYPTYFFGYNLTTWQWWAIAVPLSVFWTILDKTIIQTLMDAGEYK